MRNTTSAKRKPSRSEVHAVRSPPRPTWPPAARQGEQGTSQFSVSLEDDFMPICGAERVKGVMKSWPEDMPIENAFISKSIESAQNAFGGTNFAFGNNLF